MKKLIFLILPFIFVNVAHATSYNHTSTIHRLGSIESRSDGDYIVLNNFTTAGTCPLSIGLVVARFRTGEAGARTFSIALAAKMAGKKVRLSVNDSIKNNNGSCYVNSIEIAD